jgi:hypothetical protein
VGGVFVLLSQTLGGWPLLCYILCLNITEFLMLISVFMVHEGLNLEERPLDPMHTGRVK